MTNRIWIALDRPNPKDTPEEQDAFALQQCALAGRVLVKLGVRDCDHFGWSSTQRRYTRRSQTGDIYLPEYGDWFNLDILSH
jgi:hypothetical protein